MFNNLCWSKIEKVNTLVILYCLYHFRGKRKVADSKVTDWIKGVFTMVGTFNGLLVYEVDYFLVLFNAVQTYNN